MRKLCEERENTPHVVQGNIAFASGCVRAGIDAVEGYPGTPSTEVIDKGLAKVQDKIRVGWAVNEAVAAGMGVGASLAGKDAVVTMKIPGVFQAGDVFTSASTYSVGRGGLVFYVASDFAPNSTQHLVDPRYLYKSCFLPVFEPRNHQEMHEAAKIAVEISRTFKTAAVVHASGLLCHSEGLIRLIPQEKREEAPVDDFRAMNSLPNNARKSYDRIMDERMPQLADFVENSPLNKEYAGTGKKGVITYGSGSLYMEEYRAVVDSGIDVLSLAFTNPLPMEKIKAFVSRIHARGGNVYVLEDGYRFVEEHCRMAGLNVIGKPLYNKNTEWNFAGITEFLGGTVENIQPDLMPMPRPPMICAGCPYRLTGLLLSRMRRQGKIEAIFGDIGCNTLLYFMGASDTCLAMGASESMRAGFVNVKPDSQGKVVSILGDGTECHSGLDATRNSLFRHIGGLKIILDNEWIGMTGGQPSPTSPVNLGGQASPFKLEQALEAEGAEVIGASAYDYKELQAKLKEALEKAEQGDRLVVLVVKGTCIRKVPASEKKARPELDPAKCVSCGSCLICPGIAFDSKKKPDWNNLCTSCAGGRAACMEMCPRGAISQADKEICVRRRGQNEELFTAPDEIFCSEVQREKLPERLSLAIRGVGGQGNLFFGKVLAQLAFLAGYDKENIVKGETHGMAQMGGPVISTFACGHAYSPELAPCSADCLIVMEKSEVLRPGFLSMLKKGGTILLAETKVLPQGQTMDKYPGDSAIAEVLKGFQVRSVDVLAKALSLGDKQGKCANIVMLGILSKTAPFCEIPESLWLKALQGLSPKAELWERNYKAFMLGRE